MKNNEELAAETRKVILQLMGRGTGIPIDDCNALETRLAIASMMGAFATGPTDSQERLSKLYQAVMIYISDADDEEILGMKAEHIASQAGAN